MTVLDDSSPPSDDLPDEFAVPLWPDACQLLKGIDRSTFYRYQRQGWITSFPHGGRTYVPISAIREYWHKRFDQANKEQAQRRKDAERKRKHTGKNTSRTTPRKETPCEEAAPEDKRKDGS